MLRYITEMPPEDCSKERGYALPFHSDMVFQFQNKNINDKFFALDSDLSVQISADKNKYGSNQMIEVLMTPTSESSDNLNYDDADNFEEQLRNEDLDVEANDSNKKKTNSIDKQNLKDEDAVVNDFSAESPEPKINSYGHE